MLFIYRSHKIVSQALGRRHRSQIHPLRLVATLVVSLGLLFSSTVQAGQSMDPSDPERLWALVIGVSNYAHAEPLLYGATDALAYSEFLQSPQGGGMLPDHVFTLTEEAATRMGVLVEFAEMQDRVQEGDRIYIYIAGHGYLKRNIGYFVPIDGTLKLPEATAVPLSFLKELVELGLSHAGVRIMITDMCNAGRLGPEASNLTLQIQNVINEQLANVNPGQGTFLNLLASRFDEASFESDALGHGVFTHTLLEALNGDSALPGESIVAAQRMVEYVQSEVPKYTGDQQHPVVNQDYAQALAVAFLDRPGPIEVVPGIQTTLTLLNVDQRSYTRVEWVDPATNSKAIRQLSGTSIEIGSLEAGELEFRFYDPENRTLTISVSISPGENTLDVLTTGIAGLGVPRTRPAGPPVQIAALGTPLSLPAQAAPIVGNGSFCFASKRVLAFTSMAPIGGTARVPSVSCSCRVSLCANMGETLA